MTCLPIVARELRQAARRRRTYWLRAGAALLAAIIALGMLLPSYRGTRLPTDSGQAMFWLMSAVALAGCLFAGVFTTADSLSEEKRDGTLGLLLLTPLRGYDVVFGKLVVAVANVLSAVAAVVPVLALAVLLGGVTLGEFWRVTLLLANTLFLSASLGLWVSALSRDGRRAIGGTALLLVALAGGFPLWSFAVQSLSSSSGLVVAFQLPSPAFSGYRALEAQYPAAAGRFWGSLATQHLLAWAFLAGASWLLPRAWQDVPASVSERNDPWLRVKSLLPTKLQFLNARSKLTDENPVLRLAGTHRRSQVLLWSVFAAAALLALWTASAWKGVLPEGSPLVGAILVSHLVTKLCLAWQASRRLAEDRRRGALEMLLTTPLDTHLLVRGWLIGLKRAFLAPVAFLIGVSFAVLVGGWVWLDEWDGEALEPLILFFAPLALAGDAYALCWMGLWRGLVARSSARAWVQTLTLVLVLPWIGLSACAAIFGLIGAGSGFQIEPGLLVLIWWTMTVLADVGCTGWAINALRDDFREAAAQWAAPVENWHRALWRRRRRSLAEERAVHGAETDSV
ncbi:MAG: ABC transporter permease subunit [Verrucomicrobia bacterium]|nr:ABC transporter permease subunit [Verrucomicrobiota bacterium]